MLNIRNRKLAVIWFFLLTSFGLSSCASDQKAVDPYRDSSYTSSVAPAPSGKAAPALAPAKTLQAKPVKPSLRQQTQPSAEISSNTMLPLLALVNDRIVAYEEKVAQWENFIAEASTINLDEEPQNRIAGCQGQLMTILAGYNELHQKLISKSSGQAGEVSITAEYLAAERQDLNFLENACQQIMMSSLQTGDWAAGTRERLLLEKERELNENMASGKYQQVIELYNQLPLDEEGGRRASYSASYSYGQALLRTGREVEAAAVFQDLLTGLQELSQIEREFKLMQLIADIQFGMENYDKAFERYVDIINRYAGLGENIEWARKQQSVISVRNSQGIEVRNFSELMRSYLTYNADRDGFRVFLLASRFLDDFPESSVIATVNHILFESRDRGEAWFAVVLQRISVLQEEMKYQEALQVIDQISGQEMPMDKMDLLDSLTDELISASFEEEKSRRLAVEEAMQEIWSTGQNYLRAKEYDQAMEVFSTLLETSYAERANDKIVEAAQLAAQGDRREAAELFVRAGKSKDQDNRIALLLKSRQLLKGILEKYPQSGLIEKTERNLYRIEQEIKSIDPVLLTEPQVTEDDQAAFQQPVRTTVNGIPLKEWEEKVPSNLPH